MSIVRAYKTFRSNNSCLWLKWEWRDLSIVFNITVLWQDLRRARVYFICLFLQKLVAAVIIYNKMHFKSQSTKSGLIIGDKILRSMTNILLPAYMSEATSRSKIHTYANKGTHVNTEMAIFQNLNFFGIFYSPSDEYLNLYKFPRRKYVFSYHSIHNREVPTSHPPFILSCKH